MSHPEEPQRALGTADSRAIAQTETDREAALRHEALLDVVARAQAHRESERHRLVEEAE
jgi:hypothetical protein